MTGWPAFAVAVFVVSTLVAAAGAQDGAAGKGATGRQAASVSALQADVALRMRRALAGDSNFIARATAFAATNPTRFAGMETGRQKQLIDNYLKAVRGLPWSDRADGTMRSDEWDRRESAAIFKLETEPDFLDRVAAAEGMSLQALVQADALLLRRIRAHVGPEVAK